MHTAPKSWSKYTTPFRYTKTLSEGVVVRMSDYYLWHAQLIFTQSLHVNHLDFNL